MLTISYFSYKGGSGRSSLIYNTIPFLVNDLNASEEHPIIVVDLDADSAGLSYLLTEDKIKENKQTDFLTTNMLIDEKVNLFGKYLFRNSGSSNFKNFELYRMFLPVGAEFGLNHLQHDRSVLFVPVKPDKTISKFDGPANNKIGDFLSVCENYGASAVVFDMPAGGQIIGGEAFQQSDKILVCMRITKQHRMGTLDYLKEKMAGVSAEFIPVFNVVPQEKILIDDKEFSLEEVRRNLKQELENLKLESEQLGASCKFNFKMLDYEYYGIPEVKRFKFIEGILYAIKNKNKNKDKSLSEDEEKAYESYEYLAKIIAEDAE